MRTQLSAVLFAWLCLGSPAFAVDEVVHFVVPPPLGKDIAAMPQIAAPSDDAQRRINAALKQFDRDVLGWAKECDEWSRVIDVPMRGPSFLSFTVTDFWYCKGAPHPNEEKMAIVYDLSTGKPVDWTSLLPPSLTGTLSLEDQAGTKTVQLSSQRLFDLYVVGYQAAHGDDCADALVRDAPGMSVWLDAKAGGLAVWLEFAHAAAACDDAVVIPASVLRAEGAAPALLKAFEATP